jgi:hypothetical protein
MTKTMNSRLPDGRLLVLIRMEEEELRGLGAGKTSCLNVPNTPYGTLLLLIDIARTPAENTDHALRQDAHALATAILRGELLIQAGKEIP